MLQDPECSKDQALQKLTRNITYLFRMMQEVPLRPATAEIHGMAPVALFLEEVDIAVMSIHVINVYSARRMDSRLFCGPRVMVEVHGSQCLILNTEKLISWMELMGCSLSKERMVLNDRMTE